VPARLSFVDVIRGRGSRPDPALRWSESSFGMIETLISRTQQPIARGRRRAARMIESAPSRGGRSHPAYLLLGQPGRFACAAISPRGSGSSFPSPSPARLPPPAPSGTRTAPRSATTSGGDRCSTRLRRDPRRVLGRLVRSPCRGSRRVSARLRVGRARPHARGKGALRPLAPIRGRGRLPPRARQRAPPGSTAGSPAWRGQQVSSTAGMPTTSPSPATTPGGCRGGATAPLSPFPAFPGQRRRRRGSGRCLVW